LVIKKYYYNKNPTPPAHPSPPLSNLKQIHNSRFLKSKPKVNTIVPRLDK
jgi:hypothetical protein